MLSYIKSFFTSQYKEIPAPSISDEVPVKKDVKTVLFKKGIKISENHKAGVKCRNRIF